MTSFQIFRNTTLIVTAVCTAPALVAQFPPAGTIYPNAQYPYSVASADFNGDGAPDLVTCAQSSPGHANLFLNANDGSGTFGAAIPFSVGNGSSNIATGDFDGDGRQDLATANRSGVGSVSILWGTGIAGAGAFTGLQNLATSTGAAHLAVGDVNGDGRLDIVTANSGSGQINVFLNNEGNVHRSFLPRVLYSAGPLHPPSDIDLGDLNGDGKLDIVTANNNDSTISVLLGTGTGAFGAYTHYSVPGPFYLTLGDLNHDGKLDVVSEHANAHSIFVLLGTGTGGFGAATGYAIPGQGSPRSSAIGDVDHDGNPDVVVGNYATAKLQLFLGDGTGALTSHSLHDTGYSPFEVLLADFNADGWLDAATANYIGNSVSVFLNTPILPDACAALVLDRSGSMSQLRSGTNLTRAADSVDFARADIDWLFTLIPPPTVLLYECHNGTVTRIGTSYDNATAAKAALNSLPAPSGNKPIAAAICRAVADLVALNPSAPATTRSLLIYSDDGADASPASSCRGVLPSSSTGDSCAQAVFQGPGGAFGANSWQQAVCDVIEADVAMNAYYFSMFADVVTNEAFLAALCEVTGGALTGIPDGSTMPRFNPWRSSGQGCVDHAGTTLRMVRDGIPQLGETVQVGCRTGANEPFLLGFGFSNQRIGGTPLPFDLGPLGAPGCAVRTSWDVTDGIYLGGTARWFTIPNSPALNGLPLWLQAAELHPANNTLGVATSDLLRMQIVQ